MYVVIAGVIPLLWQTKPMLKPGIDNDMPYSLGSVLNDTFGCDAWYGGTVVPPIVTAVTEQSS